MTPILYLSFIAFELIFAFLMFVYTVSAFYSSFMGSAYVPTRAKEIDKILKAANLKPNQIFYDLGCGDGRVVEEAVRHYKVRGWGIDVNPVLIFWSNLRTNFRGVKNLKYKTQNIFATDLGDADVIYLFLMPELLAKLAPKLKEEVRKNTLIISHAFRMEPFDNLLVKTLEGKPFPTYIYRV